MELANMKSGRQKIKELKVRVAELERLVEHYKLVFENTRPMDYFQHPVHFIPQKPLADPNKITC